MGFSSCIFLSSAIFGGSALGKPLPHRPCCFQCPIRPFLPQRVSLKGKWERKIPEALKWNARCDVDRRLRHWRVQYARCLDACHRPQEKCLWSCKNCLSELPLPLKTLLAPAGNEEAISLRHLLTTHAPSGSYLQRCALSANSVNGKELNRIYCYLSLWPFYILQGARCRTNVPTGVCCKPGWQQYPLEAHHRVYLTWAVVKDVTFSRTYDSRLPFSVHPIWRIPSFWFTNHIEEWQTEKLGCPWQLDCQTSPFPAN